MAWGRAKLFFTSIFFKKVYFPTRPSRCRCDWTAAKRLNAALAECSWFRKLTVSLEGLWCHGKICVPFPTTTVNENVQLRSSRASVSVLTEGSPFCCMWKNMKWYGYCDRPPVCPELTFIDFNQFVPFRKYIQNMQHSCKPGSVPVLQEQQFLVISSICCHCSHVTAHSCSHQRPINQWTLETGDHLYRGLQWNPNLDHTPPVRKEEQDRMQKGCPRSMSSLLDHT